MKRLNIKSLIVTFLVSVLVLCTVTTGTSNAKAATKKSSKLNPMSYSKAFKYLKSKGFEYDGKDKHGAYFAMYDYHDEKDTFTVDIFLSKKGVKNSYLNVDVEEYDGTVNLLKDPGSHKYTKEKISRARIAMQSYFYMMYQNKKVAVKPYASFHHFLFTDLPEHGTGYKIFSGHKMQLDYSNVLYGMISISKVLN